MITELRGDARVSVFSGGDLYRKADGDRIGHALVKDVSATGLKVETLDCLNVGERIFVDFRIGKRAMFMRMPVRVERIQSHAGSYHSGLRFQNEEDRMQVRQALAALFDGKK
jgi:hypothetical protein